MKFTLALAVVTIASLMSVAFTAQGTCASASYCMSCAEDKTDECVQCFNWGSGTIGARQVENKKCTNAVANKVADCKYYNGYISTSSKRWDCQMCDGKAW